MAGFYKIRDQVIREIDMPIGELFALMHDLKVAKPSDLVGVPLAEVRDMERFFAVKFPAVYVQFLHRCGRSAGFLAGWWSIYFDDLKEVASDFEQISATRAPATALPKGGVFIANQGLVFDYLLCNSEPDPAVWRVDFSHSVLVCEEYASSYTEYLESFIRSATARAVSLDDMIDTEVDSWSLDGFEIELSR